MTKMLYGFDGCENQLKAHVIIVCLYNIILCTDRKMFLELYYKNDESFFSSSNNAKTHIIFERYYAKKIIIQFNLYTKLPINHLPRTFRYIKIQMFNVAHIDTKLMQY